MLHQATQYYTDNINALSAKIIIDMKNNLLFNQVTAIGKRLAMVLTMLLVVGVGSVWGETYERLTSIANIDESAQYVLGVDGTGFHYSGTSSWGKIALPANQTPYKYTLKKAADGKSFTAKTTINSTTYYLQIPTSSNTFSMATSTGTNTDIIIGTTTNCTDKGYAVANKTTTTRHLRINGTSGLRSYAGTTGSIAFFYKVVSATKTLSSISVSGQTTSYNVGDDFSFDGICTAKYSDNSTKTVTPSSVSSPDMNNAGTPSVTVSYTEGGVTVNATYTITVTASAGGGGSECTWQLVTDASTLKVDDEIIIAASNNNYAISTNQANNNRTATSITKEDNILTNPSSSVQILTLKNGTVDGTWAFYTGSGYLYAASSSGNQLKTQTTNNANGSWTISISNKIASIKANGTNTRNVMQFNPNNGSPIFACYSSASMQAIALYKKVCTGGSTQTTVCLSIRLCICMYAHAYASKVTFDVLI